MKFFRVFLAVLLCMAVPMCAFAETNGAMARISDIQLQYNGETVLDLTGLSAEVQLAELADGIAARLLSEANGKTALDAKLNIGETIALMLEGMQQAGMAKLESVQEIMDEMLGSVEGSFDADFTMNGVPVAMGEEEMAAIENLIAALIGINLEPYTVGISTEEYDGVEYARRDYQVKADAVGEKIEEILTILDNAGSLTQSLYESMELEAGQTLTGMWKESGMQVALEGSYWYAEDNDFTYDLYLTFTQEGQEGYFDLEMYLDTKLRDNIQSTLAQLSAKPNGERTGVLQFSMDQNYDESEALTLECSIWDFTESEDGNELVYLGYNQALSEENSNVYYFVGRSEDSVLEITVECTPGDPYGLYVSLAVTEDDSTQTLVLECDTSFDDTTMIDAVLHVWEDDTMISSMGLNYTGTYAGGVGSGVVTLDFMSGEDVFSILSNLDFGAVELNEGDLIIDTENALDILDDATDADGINAWLVDLAGILQGAGTTILSEYPDLASLLG